LIAKTTDPYDCDKRRMLILYGSLTRYRHPTLPGTIMSLTEIEGLNA
jgi:hypothetical protein